MTSDRKCKRCRFGMMTCPRCGGSGRVGGSKRITYYEKCHDTCGQCWGSRTISCVDCGGCGSLPPRRLLRSVG